MTDISHAFGLTPSPAASALAPIHRPSRTIVERAKTAYQERRQRERIFGDELFADPVWDLLLDLFIARAECRAVSVSSACVAASVPKTTAIRYINNMVATGLLARAPHPHDTRSTLLELTDRADELMNRYLQWLSDRDAGRTGPASRFGIDAPSLLRRGEYPRPAYGDLC